MPALDLTKDVPRSPFDDLGGFCWLPRLVDKARAFYAGTHGEYADYPCPGDKNFLQHFGLDAQALGARIQAGDDDAAIAAWVQANARDGSDAAKAAYRRRLLGPARNPFIMLAVWYLRRRLDPGIRARSPNADPARLKTIPRLLAAEEGHPLPPP